MEVAVTREGDEVTHEGGGVRSWLTRFADGLARFADGLTRPSTSNPLSTLTSSPDPHATL